MTIKELKKLKKDLEKYINRLINQDVEGRGDSLLEIYGDGNIYSAKKQGHE